MATDEQWMTFDCYGTLLDWQSAFREILAPVSHGRVDDLVEAFHSVEPEVERELSTASYREILREGVRRAATKSGVALGAGDLDRLPERWGSLRAFADTPAALQSLKDQGWKLGILTNCDNDLFESTRTALGAEIDIVVTAEEVGSYKPSIGHFEQFQARSDVERANWVHAAVSWWHDMEPARRFGVRRVWVDRENSGHDASTVTCRVTTMAELAAVAAELHRAL